MLRNCCFYRLYFKRMIWKISERYCDNQELSKYTTWNFLMRGRRGVAMFTLAPSVIHLWNHNSTTVIKIKQKKD